MSVSRTCVKLYDINKPHDNAASGYLSKTVALDEMKIVCASSYLLHGRWYRGQERQIRPSGRKCIMAVQLER